MAHGSVLVAEGDPRLRTFLLAAVQETGFAALEAHDGQEAILRTSIDRPNVIVLDLDLPDLHGLELLKRVRECTDVPIIGLMARGAAWTKEQILTSGGSDYLVKPFGAVTFAAHVRGMVRVRARTAELTVHKTIRCGSVTIDLVRQCVLCDGREIKLTPREYSVLRLLARNTGRVITHDEILGHVWGRQPSAPKAALHTYVSRLRRKLEPDRLEPRLIVTKAGGYSMAGQPASEPVARAS